MTYAMAKVAAVEATIERQEAPASDAIASEHSFPNLDLTDFEGSEPSQSSASNSSRASSPRIDETTSNPYRIENEQVENQLLLEQGDSPRPRTEII